MGDKFAAEYKLDGERVQLHIEGEKSRNCFQEV